MTTITSFQDFQNDFTLTFLHNRKILGEGERVSDLYQRVISALLDVERSFHTPDAEIESLKQDLLEACSLRIIALGAPILLNAGKEDRSLSSCTIIPVDLRKDFDSMKKSIFPYYQKDMGSGFNLNDVDDPISTLEKLNRILIEITPYVNRPPCGMAMLNIDHPKIEEFILLKKNADFNKWRFNLSVGITKEFMDSFKVKGHFTLKNGAIVDSEKLFHLMTDAAYFCGEPGMVFLDAIQQENPVPSIECKTVVPCAEMALSEGEVCQFSYLNVSKMVIQTDEKKRFDFSSLEKHTKLLTRILDNAIEFSIKNAVSHPEIIAAKRRIAIGICGAADLFLSLGQSYDSKSSQELLSDIMATIQVSSKEMSVELAEKRGSFPLFYLSRYLENGFTSRFKKNPSRISSSRWELLEQDIVSKGLRNSGTTALPPTGISAIIVNASPSIEPRFSLKDFRGNLLSDLEGYLQDYWDKIQLNVEMRKTLLAKIHTLGFIPKDMENISNKIKHLFQVSHQVNWKSHLNMVASVRKFNDESVSKTVNCPQNTSPSEIAEIFLRSFHLGLKGITVFRDKCLEEREKHIQGT